MFIEEKKTPNGKMRKNTCLQVIKYLKYIIKWKCKVRYYTDLN